MRWRDALACASSTTRSHGPSASPKWAAAGWTAPSRSRSRRNAGRCSPSGRLEAERRRLLDALREDAIVLVRRRGTPVDVVDGQLVGSTRPVGVQPGYAIADDLKRAGWAVEMSSRDHLVQLSRLSRGELDAIALSAFRWAQLQAAGGVALDDLEALPRPILTKRYFLGLSHAFVAAHPALAQRLWATTREVRTSAAFRRREQAAITEALTPRSSP